MKKIIFAFACIACSLAMLAQNEVYFEFSDGISDGQLKRKMESQMSKLLTAINNAEIANDEINYTGIDIDTNASMSLGLTWNNVHFRTADSEIVEHCVRLERRNGTLRGYQVRNIGVEMRPLDSAFDNKNKFQELCVQFDSRGRIADINFAMETTQYQQLIKEGVRLDDLDRRMQIIQWCEQFRKAYCDKNIRFMQDIFSDDALIITGKVVMDRVKSDVQVRDQQKVIFVEKNKKQYLASLLAAFNRNSYINVNFDSYEIKRHGSKPQYYAVTLHQKWYSTTYNDEGMVVLVWDFTDEEKPVIQVRTWQPMNTEIIGMSDLKLP